MHLSTQWLSELTGQTIAPASAAIMLTMAGLEEESSQAAAPDFSGVFVGHVIEKEAHPSADRLSVCQVSIGKGEPLQIVCGASNVRKGLKVAVVIVGGLLPDDFKIEKAKLRGVASHGMICSTSELGLGQGGDGIMELAEDAPIGEDFRIYYGLNDVVIDIAITPNRADCLSMHGMAREWMALNRLSWSPSSAAASTVSYDQTQLVRVVAEADCPRYLGRLMNNINPAAALPLQMRERLRRAGIGITGLSVVDCINYVMLETGQPMHAFDAARVSGDIVVRHAQEGESLVVLGGATVSLKPADLVVCDENAPIALAGVIGGEASAVTEATTSIFLESAYFSPMTIARSAKAHGLSTDSSYRFERGVDFALQEQALERVTQVIQTVCGEAQTGAVVSALAPQHYPARAPIAFRANSVKRYLGESIPDADIEKILSSLALPFTTVSESVWSVVPPTFRFDIEQEVDLVEEVIRLYGYDRIPVQPLVGELSSPTVGAGLEDRLYQGKMALVERDYAEAVTYSFVSPDKEQALSAEQTPPLRLMNPLGSDLSVMRRSLLCGLLQALQYNANRQHARVRLFEHGKCFFPADTVSATRQVDHIAGVAVGAIVPRQWGELPRALDYYDVKQDVVSLFSALGLQPTFEAGDHPSLHPYQQQTVHLNGQRVGYVGALHPEKVVELDLPDGVFVFELEWAPLIVPQRAHFETFSRFPATKRELSFVADESVAVSDICDNVRQLSGRFLSRVKVHDVYRSEQIGHEKKSVSLALSFQDTEQTLVDEQIDAIIGTVIDGLAVKLGTQLRD